MLPEKNENAAAHRVPRGGRKGGGRAAAACANFPLSFAGKVCYTKGILQREGEQCTSGSI